MKFKFALIQSILVLAFISCIEPQKEKSKYITNIVAPLESLIKVDSGYILSGTARIYYKVIGQGEPIVFLHGGPGGYFAHDYPYFESLKDRYKLIFFDQRGTGNSECELNENEVNIENFINDITILTEHLKIEKFNLVGVSWGGLLSIMYALQNPSKVQDIVLVGTAGLESDFLSEMTENLNKRISKEDRKKISALYDKMNDENLVEVTEAIGKIFYKSYVKNPKSLKEFKPNMNFRTAKNQNKINIILWRELRNKKFNFYKDLNKLSNGILILRGDYDPIPLKYSVLIEKNAPNAQLRRISNSGHMPHIEENELTLKLIQEFFN